MDLQIGDILWLMSLGVAVAVVWTFLTKLLLGRFFTALLKIDAVGPENAISPEKLGVKITSPVAFALKREGLYSRSVRSDDGGITYYIDPENKAKAEKIYSLENARFVFVLGLLLVLICIMLVAGELLGGAISDLIKTVFE